MRASAAFPPLIPPVTVSPDSEWAYEQGMAILKGQPEPREVWLTDGGAFNNFGTEWHQLRRELCVVQGFSRLESAESLTDWQSRRYGQVQLVVDASLWPKGKRMWLLRAPGLGFFIYFFRLIELIYHSTLAGRSNQSEYVAWARMRAFPQKWLARHAAAKTLKRVFEHNPRPYDPNEDSDSLEIGALKLYASQSRPFYHIIRFWDLALTLGEQYQLADDWQAEKQIAEPAMGEYWPWTGDKEPTRPKKDDVSTNLRSLGEEATIKLILEGYLKTREVLFCALGYAGPLIPDKQWFVTLLK
ncbi:MAG TPA: hypothetical protein VGD54_09415 [Steroidobacteraceae bacterium]